MVRGESPGPAPAAGPGQQLAAHPVQLADVAPAEAAQEDAQSLPSRKRGVDGALTTLPRAQAAPPARNTSASSIQSRPASSSCRRCSPAPGHRLGRGVAGTRWPRQGGRKDQPRIGHQAVVVEGDLSPVGVVAWQHLVS